VDQLNSDMELFPTPVDSDSMIVFEANSRWFKPIFCATALDPNNLDLQREKLAADSLEENRGAEKRLSRGLEDVSRLFLSQSADRAVEKAKTSSIAPAQAQSEPAQSRAPFLLHDSPAVSRESILGLLNGSAAVLEEGLRAIDENIPCDPFGFIDLVVVDSRDRICIVNVDVVQKDESLLRGMAYFDWIVRNTPIVRRMYQGRVIDFSAQPRLFLVAPGFSPLLRCVAQRSTSPEVRCFEYRTMAMPGGIGILFEHAWEISSAANRNRRAFDISPLQQWVL
jgi:hypothetical protein